MPRLSIVIPWIGSLESFEDTLAAVLQNRPHGCEILVAPSESYDDPHGLADEVNFLPPTKTSSLAALVNAALPRVQSPVLQVIPCGYMVEESWASAALLQFDDAQIAAVASVAQRVDQRDKVLAAGVDYVPGGGKRLAQAGSHYELARLAQARPLGATLAGGYFRTAVLSALGGFDASLDDSLSDVDLALCQAQLGLRTECEPTSVLLQTAAVKVTSGTFGQGKAAEVLYRRHFGTWEPKDAKQSHRLQVAGECLRSLVQPWWLAHLSGRLLGMVTARFDNAHATRLSQAKERLAAAATEANILRLPSRTAPAPQRRAA